MSFLISIFEFLLRSLFDLAIFAFISRFILQLVAADRYNPVSQLIVKMTDPLLKPLKRYIPSFGKIDTACICIIILLTILKITSIFLIQFHKLPHISGLLLWTVSEVIAAILYFFFFTLLAQILLRWLHSGQVQALNTLLEQITAPLMQPIKRLLKPIGGYDLTPLLVLICLQLLIIIITTPLARIGLALALHP